MSPPADLPANHKSYYEPNGHFMLRMRDNTYTDLGFVPADQRHLTLTELLAARQAYANRTAQEAGRAYNNYVATSGNEDRARAVGYEAYLRNNADRAAGRRPLWLAAPDYDEERARVRDWNPPAGGGYPQAGQYYNPGQYEYPAQAAGQNYYYPAQAAGQYEYPVQAAGQNYYYPAQGAGQYYYPPAQAAGQYNPPAPPPRNAPGEARQPQQQGVQTQGLYPDAAFVYDPLTGSYRPQGAAGRQPPEGNGAQQPPRADSQDDGRIPDGYFTMYRHPDGEYRLHPPPGGLH